MTKGRFSARTATAVAVAASITCSVTAILATPATAQTLTSVDNLGRPSPAVLSSAEDLAYSLPPQLRDGLLAAVTFFTGDNADPNLLPENGPAFSQFIWPTVSRGCIDGGGDSVASAIAVPGPADLPLPGVAPGAAAFVFTALGTPAATDSTLNVRWINVTTGRAGATTLQPTGINPTGPATVNGTADVGSGHVFALVDGTVNGCYFPPTVASFNVP